MPAHKNAYYERLQAAAFARLKKNPAAYGGELRNTRAGRARPRPLATKHSMHLILRSSKAKGDWSFRRPAHAKKIQAVLTRFAAKYEVRIHRQANVGNHLHLHVQLRNLDGYKPFIRAITSAIAMGVTGASRWRKGAGRGKFWDLRPYTRLVFSHEAFKRLTQYILLNQLEAMHGRFNASYMLAAAQDRRARASPD